MSWFSPNVMLCNVLDDYCGGAAASILTMDDGSYRFFNGTFAVLPHPRMSWWTDLIVIFMCCREMKCQFVVLMFDEKIRSK